MALIYETNRAIIDIYNDDIGPDNDYENEASMIEAADKAFKGKSYISEEDSLYSNLLWFGYDAPRGRVKYAGFYISGIVRDSDVDKYAPTIAEKLKWPLSEVENIIKNAIIYSQRNDTFKAKQYVLDDGFIRLS